MCLITLSMVVTPHVIELLLSTLLGPLDKGFDLSSKVRYISAVDCCPASLSALRSPTAGYTR